VASPGIAGGLAAWASDQRVGAALAAAAAGVWGRIGLDLLLGALRGAHLPPEAGIILLVAFGVPWTVTALAGGTVAVVLRRVFRRYGS